MADFQAGKRYAQAAFALAVEQDSVPQWRADLADVAAVLAESQLAPVFDDGRVALERKLALVDRALAVQPLALNLAKLLVSKGRAADARAVSDAFGRLADEREGIAYANVTTAVPLTGEQLTAIETQLGRSTGKRIRAQASVDPALIGGMVARIGDQIIDGSVRTRLSELRRELHRAR